MKAVKEAFWEVNSLPNLLLKIVVVALRLLISLKPGTFSAQMNLSSWTRDLSYLFILAESSCQVSMALYLEKQN